MILIDTIHYSKIIHQIWYEYSTNSSLINRNTPSPHPLLQPHPLLPDDLETSRAWFWLGIVAWTLRRQRQRGTSPSMRGFWNPKLPFCWWSSSSSSWSWPSWKSWPFSSLFLSLIQQNKMPWIGLSTFRIPGCWRYRPRRSDEHWLLHPFCIDLDAVIVGFPCYSILWHTDTN